LLLLFAAGGRALLLLATFGQTGELVDPPRVAVLLLRHRLKCGQLSMFLLLLGWHFDYPEELVERHAL
jgi:hypothetical protein